mgnify:CR=1 FL=1
MSPAHALREHALALLSDDEHSPDAARLRALLSEPLVVPVMQEVEPGHMVACHLYNPKPEINEKPTQAI